MNPTNHINPFDRLRELSLRIPEGASELLPLVDFLEAFPEQVTEEALVHLVGVTALGIAKAGQGGLWDGRGWIFLRGSAPAFPTNPGKGWISLPWTHGDEIYGHLVLRTPNAPPALELLLSISAPLLALCDQLVAIPQSGKVTSLNAAVAAGILFYEVGRQRPMSQ